MNAKELAQKLNGSEYPLRLNAELKEQAKSAGLVIIYGASDDLMEFDGAIYDEIGCYEGGTALVDEKGLLPDRENIESDDELKDFFQGRKKLEASRRFGLMKVTIHGSTKLRFHMKLLISNPMEKNTARVWFSH